MKLSPISEYRKDRQKRIFTKRLWRIIAVGIVLWALVGVVFTLWQLKIDADRARVAWIESINR